MAEQRGGAKKRPRVNVHGVDSKGPLWRWFVVEAARQDIPLGKYLTVLILELQQLTPAERVRLIDKHRSAN